MKYLFAFLAFSLLIYSVLRAYAYYYAGTLKPKTNHLL